MTPFSRSLLVLCCAASFHSQATVLVQQLNDINAQAAAQLPSVTLAEQQLPLRVGFASGAFHHPQDPHHLFYSVSDRGPNIDCQDLGKISAAASQLCPVDADNAKIFPLPSFTPSIYRFQLSEDLSQIKGIETIALRGQSGKLLSGISNPITDSEQAFDSSGQRLTLDASGIDSEAIVKLNDGSFYLAEEYAPSLLHVAADGTVQKRYVPQGMGAAFADADYPVQELLPAYFAKRMVNRGFESLAVNPSNGTLYVMLQSPLASPDADSAKQSRIVRLLTLSLDQQGNLSTLRGEYVYQLDRASSFANAQGQGDANKSQFDVKVSEMVALANDELLVLERISQTTKIYRVTLNSGDNILAKAVAAQAVSVNEDTQAKTLEQSFDSASIGARPLLKQAVFNSLTDLPAGITLAKKQEGMALLNDRELLLMNDNDFAVFGENSQITVLKFAQPLSSNAASTPLRASLIGRYQSGQYDQSAAEIVNYHSASQRIFVVNAQSGAVDVLDASKLPAVADAKTPDLQLNNLPRLTQIQPTQHSQVALGAANSVAVHGNLLAIAIEAKNKQQAGYVALYQLGQPQDQFLQLLEVGALPDMLTFTPNGDYLLVANEGEPNSDYSVDPEGSISLIDLRGGVAQAKLTTLDFRDFNQDGPRHQELSPQVRISGGAFGQARASVAQDLEPEYISISADGQQAYVSLQENNAIAVVDINNARISRIMPLGQKDYNQPQNQVDISDRDAKLTDATGALLRQGKARIHLSNWPGLYGLYQPDSIASYQLNGQNFIITANEGDGREYIAEQYQSEASCQEVGFLWNDGDCIAFTDEFRVEDLQDLSAAGYGSQLPSLVSRYQGRVAKQFDSDSSAYGRIKIMYDQGFAHDEYQQLVSYGARSFSIWDEQGRLVFDSADDMERITAARLGEFFNVSNDRPADDKKNDRSAAKGPEPEALALGTIDGRTYAFVGLERSGGFMIYDITNPYSVQFIDYVVNRDFNKDPTAEAAGDVGPEGMVFVSAADSPTRKPLLIIGNEVSGSTSVYQLQ